MRVFRQFRSWRSRKFVGCRLLGDEGLNTGGIFPTILGR